MVQAVVLAGGAGTRLRPITVTRPKPLTPIVNRPVLAHGLELLRRNGIKEATITVFYLGEQIERIFRNGSEHSMELRYSFEEKPLGTAGSVKNLEDELDDTIIITSGDLVTDVDLQDLIGFHRNKGAIITIAMTRIPNPTSYGIISTDDQGRIVSYLEKPRSTAVFSNFVNAGIYVIEPEILRSVEKNVTKDFSKNLIPDLLKTGKELFAKYLEGFWSDIGNPDQYLQANYEILRGNTEIKVGGKETSHGVWVDKGVQIDESARIIGPVVIGTGTTISGGSTIGPLTVLGSNVTIGEGAKIERAVLFDSCRIGREASVSECVVCEGASCGAETKIGRGSILGDNCVISRGAEIYNSTMIYPKKVIPSNAVVTKDVD